MKPVNDLPKSLENDFNIKWNSLCVSAEYAKNIPRDNPEIFAALKRVFAFSNFVARSYIHTPELLKNLIESGDLQKSYKVNKYNDKLKTALLSLEGDAKSGIQSPVSSLQHIFRRFRLYEMVRIAWRDLAGWADLEETMADLSAFADACINHALSHLYKWQCLEYGIPTGPDSSQQHLVIIGMGKLGACELNFSSDIDLIFAYPEPGKTKGKTASISNDEFFVRLCRHFFNVISATTSEGFVFRVDTRLRPYGESGPLVMSFDNMEAYYQRQGREWERYAWIKARIVADEKGAGNSLLERLQPFVYRRYLDFGVFESLREMKNKISLEVKKKGMKSNIKLGPGGIREIEFFGQIFQLIRGGVTPILRERRIHKVLTALSQNNYIEQDTCNELIKAYEFLRKTEHRLQEFSDQQTHRLPLDHAGRERLAVSMGFVDWKSFSLHLSRHMERVHYHFNTLLTEKEPDSRTEHDKQEAKIEIELKGIWQNLIDNEKSINLLSDAGFDKPEEVLLLLDHLRNDSQTRALSIEGRKRLDRLIPIVLREIGKYGLPYSVLNRIIDLIKTIERRTCYIALLLENPAALTHLVKLANASPLVISFLSHHPVLLDELLDPRTLYVPPERDELEKEAQKKLESIPRDDLENQIQELCIFKQVNILRVAAADVTGAVKLMRTSDHLTEIAETIVNKVVELAWNYLIKKHGTPTCAIGGHTIDKGFAVIAYGKLGGIELGYGADLDLVFLHAGTRGQTKGGMRPIDNSQFFARLGQRIVHILTTHTTAGMLYKIDMRLRPSGSAGPLVCHIDSFSDYQIKNAWTWEHQALVRARPISGNIKLTKYFKQIRKEALARPRIKSTLQKEVCTMRERMRKELLSPEPEMFDLIQDKGGIVDIEFLVQYLVLLKSHEYAELLKWTDNVRILETLTQTGIIDKDIAILLKEAFLTYRSAVHKLRLQEKPARISENEFYGLRKEVKKIWKRFLEE
ncbi:MAG: bifunctional [glutamate--ammonia ligase]-adenylyl-L-tyrosine phosphorylase/[glutamate--ammonia-ligase] adenylyltransferase [Desulfobacteraceae bacterium]|nr:bifunctional [glutamate--ammonia ligase]-adenylyl-L-tyrosine phosphorylase/[glutamate--ammonia-ligase] adenylyltransferase [Pseudomonadota bacterium]MBU4462760.1 bifunctional [glutamate--ammonia ligase]-adenylyl-L-tyrosine phosphorylase/[glutamate--ammonia-ligase] adenylyltransferase [Pseudomonadota bacterium]MCG2754575.1 bifunctional [glutamate--ammonia ligase]-adenylyl-L-tyrosine phosphorylase/[glutamate--ammonia-ligase] adenylyltransferase [Desulfobacteraceae bacterium]